MNGLQESRSPDNVLIAKDRLNINQMKQTKETEIDSKEEEIKQACLELMGALIKQHRNDKDLEKVKVMEIKLRKETLQARLAVHDLKLDY